MKTIGMIGGAGWLSTLEYYRIINQEINRRLGGLNSAKIVLSSFNYREIDVLNKQDDHSGIYQLVLDAALRFKQALFEQGKTEEAAEIEKRFKEAWMYSDIELSSSRIL